MKLQRYNYNHEDEGMFHSIDGKYVLYYEAQAQIDALRAALTDLLEIYTRLANSGDAGFWDCEKESEVKSARAALNSTDPALNSTDPAK